MTNKIAYFQIGYEPAYGTHQIAIATKQYYDVNHCINDQEISNTPLGKALESIGLECEDEESIFATMDLHHKPYPIEISIEEIINRMAKIGWTLLPFPKPINWNCPYEP